MSFSRVTSRLRVLGLITRAQLTLKACYLVKCKHLSKTSYLLSKAKQRYCSREVHTSHELTYYQVLPGYPTVSMMKCGLLQPCWRLTKA